MTITMGLLAEYPEHLPTVAGWIYDEWAHRRPGTSVAEVATRLRTHLGRDQLPVMLLALDGVACVGCASLRVTDLEGRDDLSPWLASVYVPVSRRRAGIGTQLVRAAEAEAARLGIAALFLFTPDRQAFYAALGWVECERAVHAGQTVTVMRRLLATSSATSVSHM